MRWLQKFPIDLINLIDLSLRDEFQKIEGIRMVIGSGSNLVGGRASN